MIIDKSEKSKNAISEWDKGYIVGYEKAEQTEKKKYSSFLKNIILLVLMTEIITIFQRLGSNLRRIRMIENIGAYSQVDYDRGYKQGRADAIDEIIKKFSIPSNSGLEREIHLDIRELEQMKSQN